MRRVDDLVGLAIAEEVELLLAGHSNPEGHAVKARLHTLHRRYLHRDEVVPRAANIVAVREVVHGRSEQNILLDCRLPLHHFLASLCVVPKHNIVHRALFSTILGSIDDKVLPRRSCTRAQNPDLLPQRILFCRENLCVGVAIDIDPEMLDPGVAQSDGATPSFFLLVECHFHALCPAVEGTFQEELVVRREGVSDQVVPIVFRQAAISLDCNNVFCSIFDFTEHIGHLLDAGIRQVKEPLRRVGGSGAIQGSRPHVTSGIRTSKPK
mmetsp:Transcript_34498/g.72263  ORF Transcript_34498/g.72263 Transcript_34498/m.72263 type:complete len:267 (-) Transcript_34498:558-1358(-)